MSSIEEQHVFYQHEREIFSKLVENFSRPLDESLLVMATWLWLEDFVSFEHISSAIMARNDDEFIRAVAAEAVLCFQSLESNERPNGFNKIPLTAELLKKDISLQMIYKHHRYTAIAGIKTFLTTVCSRTFTDILERVLASSSSSSTCSTRLIIPGFPHPTFGSFDVDYVPFTNTGGVWGWNPTCGATENDRSLFLTFSSGCPVSEAEVKQLFAKIYGENCVKGVYMQTCSGIGPNGQQQPLYAKLVLDSVVTVDRILEDQSIKKFHINWEKHIWARKYEKKTQKIA